MVPLARRKRRLSLLFWLLFWYGIGLDGVRQVELRLSDGTHQGDLGGAATLSITIFMAAITLLITVVVETRRAAPPASFAVVVESRLIELRVSLLEWHN